jgi:hypothetical protein
MVPIQLSVQNWVSLDQITREKLRELFNVRRSTMTVVEDQKLKCDGSTYEDLSVITSEAMQNYLETQETDFIKLFASTLDKLNGKYVPEVKPVEAPPEFKPVEKEIVGNPEMKRRGRPPKYQ